MSNETMGPISAETLYDFKPISNNRLSPDGQTIVYTVQRVDRKTEKKHSDLWVVGVDGAAPPRRYSWGDWTDTAPKWSPAGESVIFLSNRTNERQMQLYSLPIAGGESRPISDVKGTIQQFEIAPDGATIAIVLREPDPDVLEREADEQKKKLGVVAHHITRLYYKFDGVGFLPKNRSHIWLVDIESGEASQLTTGDFDIGSIGWTPNGDKLIFAANLDAEAEFNSDEVQLYTMPSAIPEEPYAQDTFTQVTDIDGGMHSPVYSPDGGQVAFYGYELKASWWQNVSLYVVPAGGGEAKNLTKAYDFDTGANTLGDIGGTTDSSEPVWSADGKSIYVQVSTKGDQPLVKFDVATGEISTVVEGVIGRFSIDEPTQNLTYLKAAMHNPGEIYSRPLAGGNEVKLTDQNAWVEAEMGYDVEEVWFTSKDGYEVQGWIMKPPGFDPAQTYPSILEIHGGPQTQYGKIFMHEFHYLASHGYVVYFSNPRGGKGYGNAHSKAIHGVWGTVDFDDLMAWADYLEQQPYIDKDRMGVTGGSYGGLMTSLIIGRTNRFKAAVPQRSVTNWISMWGSADFNQGWTKLAGVPHPWEDFEKNWHQSPISHIANAKTPTLVIHSERDYRCNLEQSEQLYVALKVLGVDAEMVVFPDESHGLSRAGRTDRRIARLEHILRWFEKYLKN